VIRSARTETPLFYAATDLRSKSLTLYDRLGRLDIDWTSVFAPLSFAFCQDKGRPTDPVVYGKCFLIGFFEDIEQDTELAARVSDSLAIRMFLFGSYSGTPPDHSSLSRVRTAVAERCDLDAVLRKTIDLLKSTGMVIDEAVAMDTTLIPSRARVCFEPLGSASAGSETSSAACEPSSSPTVSDATQTPTEADIQASAAEAPLSLPEPDEPRETPEPKMMRGFSPTSFEVLEAEEAASKAKSKKKSEPKQKLVPSNYDPEALIMRKPGFQTQPCYKVGAAVDYASRAVLAIDAYPSTIGEGQSMRSLYADLIRTSGQTPKYAVADAGMDDAGFHATVEFFGATPVTGLQANTSIASGFGKERFHYDPEQDAYICPDGQVLKRKLGPGALRPSYAANLSTCRECPLKMACYGSAKGTKTLSRTFDEDSRERVVAARYDPHHKLLLRQRKAKIEPLFSDFKEHGGLSKIWTKGLSRAKVKAKMAGIGQNIKLLLNQLETGVTANPKPRDPAAGAQNAVLSTQKHPLANVRAILRLLSSDRCPTATAGA
jgi:hypothetical protein